MQVLSAILNLVMWQGSFPGPLNHKCYRRRDNGSGSYGAPEGTRKLKSFEWLDCTNNKVLNVAIAQTIKFRMARLHKQ